MRVRGGGSSDRMIVSKEQMVQNFELQSDVMSGSSVTSYCVRVDWCSVIGFLENLWSNRVFIGLQRLRRRRRRWSWFRRWWHCVWCILMRILSSYVVHDQKNLDSLVSKMAVGDAKHKWYQADNLNRMKLHGSKNFQRPDWLANQHSYSRSFLLQQLFWLRDDSQDGAAKVTAESNSCKSKVGIESFQKIIQIQVQVLVDWVSYSSTTCPCRLSLI